MDIMRYFATMQPSFIQYIRQQDANGLDESYVLLDKNLELIDTNDMLMRKFKDGDEIWVVPAIIGGGGKRGGLLAVAALAAVFVIAPYLAPALGAAGVPGAASFATTAASQGVFAAVKASTFLTSIATNAGLALLSAVFMKKPETADTNSRNNMFGALKNTTESGTPVPIHYGLVRTGGQFISGYIQTIDHSKGADISVNSLISRTSTYTQSESAYTVGLTESLLTTSGTTSGWVQKIIDISAYDGALARAVFRYTTDTSSIGIALDTIVLGDTTFNFDTNDDRFEAAKSVSTAYTDISWGSMNPITTFDREIGAAQSGSFYIRAQQPRSERGTIATRVCWVRSPVVTLGESSSLTFYENRTNTYNNLDVYLEIVW